MTDFKGHCCENDLFLPCILARAGLLRGSFIPPAEIRHLRLIARQRQKLGGMLSAEKNRLHKVLTDAGIRLNVLVSDLHGQAGRAMVKALIADQPSAAMLKDIGRLKARREDLFEALQTDDLTATPVRPCGNHGA